MLFIIYSIVKRFELCSKNICTIIVEPIKYSLTKKKKKCSITLKYPESLCLFYKSAFYIDKSNWSCNFNLKGKGVRATDAPVQLFSPPKFDLNVCI